MKPIIERVARKPPELDTTDKEIAALWRIIRDLTGLTPEARARVLHYVWRRFRQEAPSGDGS